MATHYEIEFREQDDHLLRWHVVRTTALDDFDQIVKLANNHAPAPLRYDTKSDAVSDALTMKLRVSDCDFRVTEVLTIRGKVTPI